jgi:hypothetical protein
MSRLRSIAYAIKERLEEIPELTGKVIVYKRSDIESEFEKRMQKTRGKAVIIRVLSAKNEGRAKRSYFTGIITISLFMVPLLTAKDAKDADDLIAEIEGKVHGWWPASIPSNNAVWLKSESLAFPDADQFDVSVLTLKTPLVPLSGTLPDGWESDAGNWET